MNKRDVYWSLLIGTQSARAHTSLHCNKDSFVSSIFLFISFHRHERRRKRRRIVFLTLMCQIYHCFPHSTCIAPHRQTETGEEEEEEKREQRCRRSNFFPIDVTLTLDVCVQKNCHHSSSFSPSSSSLVFCSFSRQWYLRVYFAFLSLSFSRQTKNVKMQKWFHPRICSTKIPWNERHCIIHAKHFSNNSISRCIERELIFLIFLIKHCLSNWYSSFCSCQRKRLGPNVRSNRWSNSTDHWWTLTKQIDERKVIRRRTNILDQKRDRWYADFPQLLNVYINTSTSISSDIYLCW